MTLYLLLILLCVLLSGFFSGSETAFASLNEMRLRLNGAVPERKKARALRLRAEYDGVLITILIGNNLVNIAASSLATVIAVELMGDAGAWAATAVMTLVIITFGEILPKIAASGDAERFALRYTAPLCIWRGLLYPLEKLFGALMRRLGGLWKSGEDNGPQVTEDDLETIIETVEDEGVVDEDTAELLQSALDFDDVPAFEIITPRVDMLCLEKHMPREEMLRIAMASPYTRLPVYDGTPDNIIGVLHLSMLFRALTENPQSPVLDTMMEPLYVHKTTPLDEVLELMRRKKRHMVFVTDEYGGTMGLLTMEDVLEQLVGEIWDESDTIEEEFRPLEEDTYEVNGDMRLGDFWEEFDRDEEDLDDDNATVGGWAIEMLGGYAKPGDSFTFEELTVTVLKVRSRRILKLLAAKAPAEHEE